MPAVRPVILLENVPVPVPSMVLEVSATVGSAVILQQTPLAVTSAPPSKVILPPPTAVVMAMPVTAVDVIVGTAATVNVVNVRSEPYDVLTELVA